MQTCQQTTCQQTCIDMSTDDRPFRKMSMDHMDHVEFDSELNSTERSHWSIFAPNRPSISIAIEAVRTV